MSDDRRQSVTQHPASREQNLELLREHLAHADAGQFNYDPSLDRLNDAIALPGTDQYAPGNEVRRRLYGQLAGPAGRAHVFDGGVYDSEGTVVPKAIHLGGGRRHLPRPDPPPVPTLRLDGTWLWGGVLHPHFGHFLTESLGRLWAWPRVRMPLQGVLWLLPGGFPPHKAEQYAATVDKSYIAQTLEMLGIQGVKQLVLTEPVQIHRLLVPAQLMMNANDGDISGHPIFRRFVQGLRQAVPPPESGTSKCVYVSRAGLDSGRFVLEDELEAILGAAGWTVVRPETLGMREQIAAYVAADTIIFAEGSALHLYAMVARPEQKVAILCRRIPMKTKFEQQLRAYGLQDVHSIDAVQAVLAPTSPAKMGRQVLVHRQEVASILDWNALGEALDALGFLPKQQWRIPAADKLMFAAADVALARTAAQPGSPYAVIDRAEFLQLRSDPNVRGGGEARSATPAIGLHKTSETAAPAAPVEPQPGEPPAGKPTSPPPEAAPSPGRMPLPRAAAEPPPEGLLATLRKLLFGRR
jgi:capsular polysaccharide biosynthesis protein